MRKSLFGGYPHEGVKSREVFPNRVKTEILEGKVQVNIPDEFYPKWKENIELIGGDELRLSIYRGDFMMDRLHDAMTALGVAEKQLDDINEVYPFLPEDFGFEPVKDSEDRFTIYQKGDACLSRLSDTVWGVNSSASPHVCKVSLPDCQTAFIVLRSLGIIKDEDFEKETVIDTANAII